MRTTTAVPFVGRLLILGLLLPLGCTGSDHASAPTTTTDKGTTIAAAGFDDLPDLATFVLPRRTMPGYRLRSIGFSDEIGPTFPLVMDITYASPSGDEAVGDEIYEVQAMSAPASADLVRDCRSAVQTPAGLVCPAAETDHGRTTFVTIEGMVVRVRSRTLTDAQLAEIRDSIREVTEAEVATALAESGGTVWEFEK